MSMHYDVVIIGAGMSGLAAGIRLAYYDKRVCIVEKHYAYGGLNSYYKIDGREFDVGLHAVTNYVKPGARGAPLTKLLRQLRISHEELALREQSFCEIRFPSHRLRFTNDVAVLTDEVSRAFPDQVDAFRRLIEDIRAYDDTQLDPPHQSTRAVLAEYLSDPQLIDMVLCPVMYYGCAGEHDMDFLQFVIMFKALYLEGFARPRDGVRHIIKTLVKKYRSCGGSLRMRCGVEKIEVAGSRATGVTLDTRETLTADAVLSSIGAVETLGICPGAFDTTGPIEPGIVSFVESIVVLDRLPQSFGHESTITFFNDAARFTYARPDEPVDVRSGVLCCPSNYSGHGDMEEGLFRVTWLANSDKWEGLDDAAYASLKEACKERLWDEVERSLPGFRDHVLYTDMFTPRTIRRFTGRLHGAVYGTPHKFRDGRTGLDNLFLCGTDQGYLGIIGAMLSGITMANMHVLSRE